jgi:hypothetical protein
VHGLLHFIDNILHMGHQMIGVEHDLFLDAENVLTDRGHIRVLHIHGDRDDLLPVLRGELSQRVIQTFLIQVIAKIFQRSPFQIDDNRKIVLPACRRLFVHAHLPHKPLLFPFLPPRHRTFHNVPGFFPATAKNFPAPRDVSLT